MAWTSDLIIPIMHGGTVAQRLRLLERAQTMRENMTERQPLNKTEVYAIFVKAREKARAAA